MPSECFEPPVDGRNQCTHLSRNMTRPLGIRAACIAGTPDRPTMLNEPPFGAAGAGAGPGAGTAGALKQLPDWQPAPQ